MKNKKQWVPSKFIIKNGKLVVSSNPQEIGIGSRLIATITASFYDRYIKEYARGTLLDLGCGKVPLYEAYREFIALNICVDWSNTSHKNHYLDLEYDLNKILPFKNGSFNTIIMSDVLEHIAKPELLWIEMNRILAPSGRILMNVPFYYWLHETPYDYYRFTEFALRRFTELAGLRVLVLESVGGVPEIIADILGKNVLLIPYMGKYFSLLIQKATLTLLKIKACNRFSMRTKKQYPIGYFLVAEK